MSKIEMRVFLVPVMVAVVAPSAEEAVETASGSLEHMLEVSNDEKTIVDVSIYQAQATGETMEVDEEADDLLPIHIDAPMRAVVKIEEGLVQSVVSNVPLELLVADYDVQGADKSELTDVNQGDGTTKPAACQIWKRDHGATVNQQRLEETWSSVEG